MTPPQPTERPLPTIYPPREPQTQDGSLSELVRALAAINARLLAEAQQTGQAA